MSRSGAAVRVRPAVAGDRAFVRDAAERLASFGPPPWRTAAEVVGGEVRTLEAFFEAPPPGAAVLVAESEGEGPLGFAYLERVRDYFTLEHHGHLGMLVVGPRAEGRGIGSLLMRAAEAWARDAGYRLLTLNVFAGNERARSMYERLGYRTETLRCVKLLDS